jgi:hypothetical protein
MTMEPDPVDDPGSPTKAGASAGSPLPIEGLGDISLADLLGQPGCPLCRLRRDSSERYLRALLWEGVNDIGLRERLSAGRGFCRRHAHEVLAADRAQSGGSVGAAILLGAMARGRLVELRRLPTNRTRRTREAVRTASEPAACPVCEHVAAAERMAVDRLLARLSDASWREALSTSELCLDDLLRTWAAATDGRHANWPEVAAVQVQRIERLVERLDSFAHHSSHDRRHLLTETERTAADDAAAFLGGGR